MMVRTLIADSGQLALVGLRAILSEVSGVELVGEAHDAIELQAQLVRLRPDVVLVDHTAAGFDAAAIRDGLKRSRRTRFVALTHDPSSVAITSALRAGVCGYIKKDCDVEEIIDAVIATGEGRRFFCGKILETMKRTSLDVQRIVDGPLDCAPVSLSEREFEIIGLIAEGCSYTRIAERLHLSAHTVTTHRKNIMQKLGVNNTAALVLYAVKHDLVSPNKFLFNV